MKTIYFECMCFHVIIVQTDYSVQVIVEKAERSDIPDIDKKKLVATALLLYFNMFLLWCKSNTGHPYVIFLVPSVLFWCSICEFWLANHMCWKFLPLVFFFFLFKTWMKLMLWCMKVNVARLGRWQIWSWLHTGGNGLLELW